MSDIPAARAILLQAIDATSCPVAKGAMAFALSKMRRAEPRRQAPWKNRMTEQKRKAVFDLARNNPSMHVSEIAALVQLNPGRVSELLSRAEIVTKGERS